MNTQNTVTVTQWFDPNVKPVHKGPYQRQYIGPGIDHPDYWDGRRWHVLDENGNFLCYGTNVFPWRGIARGRGRPAKS